MAALATDFVWATGLDLSSAFDARTRVDLATGLDLATGFFAAGFFAAGFFAAGFFAAGFFAAGFFAAGFFAAGFFAAGFFAAALFAAGFFAADFFAADLSFGAVRVFATGLRASRACPRVPSAARLVITATMSRGTAHLFALGHLAGPRQDAAAVRRIERGTLRI